MRPHALYRMVCIDCLELEKKAYYIGETARAPYDRGVEHLDTIRLNNKESPLVEHSLEQHQGRGELQDGDRQVHQGQPGQAGGGGHGDHGHLRRPHRDSAQQ